jgi:hypothetical protein
MNTTLLFVEIFIAGLQGLVWLALLILNLTGYNWLLNVKFTELGDWSFLISALIFSFSYSLGIVIDRLANLIFSAWENKIQKKYAPKENRSFAYMRYQLENESLIKQLEYSRTRLRIARSSAINHLLITIFAVGLIQKFDFLGLALQAKYEWATAIIGIGVVVLFVAAWYSLSDTNFKLIVKINQELANNKSTSARKKNA